MRKFIGILCVLLGIACMAGAVAFVIHNRAESENAAEVSETLLKDVRRLIYEQTPTEEESSETVKDETEADNETAYKPTEMPTVKVGGYDCIGILSIPVLELELPVLTGWSYSKLQNAPCHYYGSYYEGDFVIAAHNYRAHFGRLAQLAEGDLVVFTDVKGIAHYYEVVLLETLPGKATQEMITSGFDLTLYTCTLGGESRVTVRCSTATVDKK